MVLEFWPILKGQKFHIWPILSPWKCPNFEFSSDLGDCTSWWWISCIKNFLQVHFWPILWLKFWIILPDQSSKFGYILDLHKMAKFWTLQIWVTVFLDVVNLASKCFCNLDQFLTNLCTKNFDYFFGDSLDLDHCTFLKNSFSNWSL